MTKPLNAWLRSITLNTSQLQKMRAFYQAMGLNFHSRKVDKGSELLVAESNGLELILMEVDQSSATTHPQVQLVFQVKNVREACAALAKLDAFFLLEATDMPSGVLAILQDPDGRAVQLVQN